MGNMNEAVLKVDLTMTPELAARLQRDAGALEVAKAYTIETADDATLVNGELKAVKERIAKLTELKAGFVAPAKQIIANAEALFDPAIQANKQAELHHKGLLMEWTAKENARIEEERRARAEAERKARQEAEAKAAAERARAEEQAREQRRIAEEAERKRLEAEAAGNAKAAAAAAAEAAKALEKASAVQENAEIKAAELTATATAAVAPAPDTKKLVGFSMRDNWIAEIQEGKTEDDVIKAIAATLATRPDLLGLLSLNMPSANKLAKALKNNFNVPGMVAKNKPVAASRS